MKSVFGKEAESDKGVYISVVQIYCGLLVW